MQGHSVRWKSTHYSEEKFVSFFRVRDWETRVNQVIRRDLLATYFHAGFLLSSYFRPWNRKSYAHAKRRWGSDTYIYIWTLILFRWFQETHIAVCMIPESDPQSKIINMKRVLCETANIRHWVVLLIYLPRNYTGELILSRKQQSCFTHIEPLTLRIKKNWNNKYCFSKSFENSPKVINFHDTETPSWSLC
jgi:hypothetical protein